MIGISLFLKFSSAGSIFLPLICDTEKLIADFSVKIQLLCKVP